MVRKVGLEPTPGRLLRPMHLPLCYFRAKQNPPLWEGLETVWIAYELFQNAPSRTQQAE